MPDGEELAKISGLEDVTLENVFRLGLEHDLENVEPHLKEEGSMPSVNVTVQPTPNPNSMKFTLDRKVIDSGSKTFASPQAAEGSPLARAIFAVDGVSSVFLLNDFITVTKKTDTEWEKIGPEVLQAIQGHFSQV